jgi:hypothetical protein
VPTAFEPCWLVFCQHSVGRRPGNALSGNRYASQTEI